MKQKNPPLRIRPGHLVCPNCLELLMREDIESFGHCPYCDYRFAFSMDLEDFLLTPVVEQWIEQNRAGYEARQTR